MNKAVGQVIKGVGGLYSVKTDDNLIVRCKPRGKLRREGDIFIGDIVDFQYDKKLEGVIESIHKRKSILIRPYVSNIDGVVIIVSPLPEPNFLLNYELFLYIKFARFRTSLYIRQD